MFVDQPSGVMKCGDMCDVQKLKKSVIAACIQIKSGFAITKLYNITA